MYVLSGLKGMNSSSFEKLVVTGALPIKGAGARQNKPKAPALPSTRPVGVLARLIHWLLSFARSE